MNTAAEGTRPGVRAVALAYVITGLAALSLGVLFGPLQALNYSGVDLYSGLQPELASYYQGLTLHGVLNAYVFTTFFMSGLLYYLTARELDESPSLTVSWITWGAMLLGLLLTLWAMLGNRATVLYTFYAPMLADSAFYIGITLIFASSWFVGLQILTMRRRWRARHPGHATPIVAWMSAVTMIMWFLASLGATAAALLWHIPAAMGWIDGMPPLLTRTLFWWTGHPIVYFWLMPAYISWYALLPRQLGGVLISDPLARVSFILLMIFSLPVGTHHQLMDAGIPDLMRAVVIFLTFAVILPSLLTAFTVAASLEYAGRRNGARGRIDWFRRLPWRDPSVAAQLLAMLLFIIGGASGLVNGSWAVNAVIHNTTWVPGHFHATLASASALTFFGIAFWLLPNLTGKPLAAPRLALAGVWLWFAGMLVFSLGMMTAGLLGVPRRAWVAGMTAGGGFDQFYADAHWPLAAVGLAGVLLAVAIVLIFGVLWVTVLKPRAGDAGTASTAVPFADALRTTHGMHMIRSFDRLWLWTLVSIAVMAAVYGPVLWPQIQQAVPLPGIRVW